MITFIIGGIWHGAGWTFVFWGFLHGLALILHRVWTQCGFTMYPVFGWIITFNFLNITWIFFRANEWDDAIKVIKGMLGLSGIILPYYFVDTLAFLTEYGVQFGEYLHNIKGNPSLLPWILIAFAIVLMPKFNSTHIQAKYLRYDSMLVILLLLLYSLLSLSEHSTFLYFNF